MVEDGRRLEAYLHEHIPISAAMGVRVVEHGTERVVLAAPIEPNLNHRGTAFGGSVATLAILAGWAQVHFRASRSGRSLHTVIQRSAIEFVAPAEGELRATSQPIRDDEWARLERTLDRHGKGRVRAAAVIDCDGETIATFRGAYVVLAR